MTTVLSSKERVKMAIAHQEPDRVPLDYTGGNAGVDNRLMAHFGLQPGDEEGLLTALGTDFRYAYAPYNGPALHAEAPGRLIDPAWGFHRRWIENESGGYWDYCDFPLQDATLDEIEAFPFPCADDFDYANVEKACTKNRDYFLTGGGGGIVDIINQTGMLRSMEQVLIDLMTDDEAGLRLIQRRVDAQYAWMERTLEVGNGRIDALWMGEDLGTQHSPMISLDLFRKHIRPHHERMIGLAKKWNIPVITHSCGSSSWAYNDFIEMGVSVVDTLQPEAKNMEPAYLKATYGDRLAFHGCISTAGPLAYGTPAEVEQVVKDTLEIMMPGGGYLLAPTHSVQDNTPTENVIAMYEAARKYGVY